MSEVREEPRISDVYDQINHAVQAIGGVQDLLCLAENQEQSGMSIVSPVRLYFLLETIRKELQRGLDRLEALPGVASINPVQFANHTKGEARV